MKTITITEAERVALFRLLETAGSDTAHQYDIPRSKGQRKLYRRIAERLIANPAPERASREGATA